MSSSETSPRRSPTSPDQRRYQPQPQARPRHRPRYALRVPVGGQLTGGGSVVPTVTPPFSINVTINDVRTDRNAVRACDRDHASAWSRPPSRTRQLFPRCFCRRRLGVELSADGSVYIPVDLVGSDQVKMPSLPSVVLTAATRASRSVIPDCRVRLTISPSFAEPWESM